MTTDSLGSRLRIGRKSRGMTQADAAKFLGRRVMTISSYENDKTVPDVAFVDDAATLYGVELDWLARGKGAGPQVAA